MSLKQKKILIIEDDGDIAALLRLHLLEVAGELGFENDGQAGLVAARTGLWDLVLLDLRLPGLSGLDLCRTLRAEGHTLPIIMMTAKSAELDRVLGLEIGADDYITKPFSVIELLARVRAHLRRADLLPGAGPVSGGSQALVLGEIEIEAATRVAKVRGKTVNLTAREFDLLMHFAQHPQRVFRRSQLLDDVWGYGHEGYEHTVNAHINRLRAKIEKDPRKPELISTVWGVGYRFTPHAEHAADAECVAY